MQVKGVEGELNCRVILPKSNRNSIVTELVNVFCNNLSLPVKED
jgi:hypothetical protein